MASGHAGHYLKLFEKHRAEYIHAVRREKGQEVSSTPAQQ
jgi:hypothetical protein